MKNTNLQYRKPAIAARVMLIILLLTSALSLGACNTSNKYSDMEYKYILTDKWWYQQISNYPIGHFVATSNTTVFNKNDITFNIAYATHQIQVKDAKSDYPDNHNSDTYMYFGIYICPDEGYQHEDFWKFADNKYPSIESLQNIEGYTFVNGITDDKAFTDEYALIPTPFFISDGSIYNHTEKVTIPIEYVSEKHGRFLMKFVCFYYKENTNSFQCAFFNTIIFSYHELDEKTVEINFERKNFMSDEL